MPCRFSPHATKTRPALRLSETKNLHFAKAPFPRFSAIVACRDGQVAFRYQDSKTRQMRTRTLPGAQFLWLILRHVLPKGFRRARNFGFLHPNSKRLIGLLQYLLGLNPNRALAWLRKRPVLTCACCGGEMRIVKTRILPILRSQTMPAGQPG